MELRVLNYFLAIAREQSIVHAAESLHLSQPTLSTQIKNLEQELGKQLFIRGTKGSRKVTLTEEGMILRKRAEEILDLVKKAEDGIRLIAKAAKKLQDRYPGISYHLSSGNSTLVSEYLDKGLIDFGIIFGDVDLTKYNVLEMPYHDIWGVLMCKDSPLAEKESIAPADLYDVPLILSQQESHGGTLTQWLGREPDQLNIAATYNLIFNASLLVDEGLGYAIGLDKIINTTGESNLCFRPLNPRLENKMNIIWKKYQVFSKPVEKFLEVLRQSFIN